MEEVRGGRRAFTILDDLHRESLMTLIQRYKLPALAEHEIEHLVSIWHRLMPWPDAVDGLYRLKRNYIIGTLSNGNIGLLVRMARHSGLPWDAILGAEIARAYKPQRQAYLSTAVALNLEPRECMLVAAHNDDLLAASEVGYRTAFVIRPNEYGPNQDQGQISRPAVGHRDRQLPWRCRYLWAARDTEPSPSRSLSISSVERAAQ